jgi:hypothetical protein
VTSHGGSLQCRATHSTNIQHVNKVICHD